MSWQKTLEAAAAEAALLLVGPGVEDLLPPGAERRHVPPGTLIPLAEGARLAGTGRPVLAVGGDSDIYGAQLGELLHAVRRNTGLTCLVADDGIAPGATATGGEAAYPLRPLALALSAGATFVAQAVPEENLPHLVRQGMQHPGLALINLWQRRYDKEQLENLDAADGYDHQSREAAIAKAENKDRLYTGLIYHNPDREAPAGLRRAGDMTDWLQVLQ